MSLFATGLADALCATLEVKFVGRDHPWHQEFLKGNATYEQLRCFVMQQWHFHSHHHRTLMRLAASAPASGWNDVAMDAASHDPRLDSSLRARWEKVAAGLGLTSNDLAGSQLADSTRLMLAEQYATAGLPFGTAYAVLSASTRIESSLWATRRREAFREHYGLTAQHLEYFDGASGEELQSRLRSLEARLKRVPVDLVEVERACRRVLQARWDFFTTIGEC